MISKRKILSLFHDSLKHYNLHQCNRILLLRNLIHTSRYLCSNDEETSSIGKTSEIPRRLRRRVRAGTDLLKSHLQDQTDTITPLESGTDLHTNEMQTQSLGLEFKSQSHDLEFYHDPHHSSPFQTIGEDRLRVELEQAPIDPDLKSEFPTDILYQQQKLKEMKANEPVREPINPRLTNILLFPGQGSQFVGMGEKLLSCPGVDKIYERASSILGYDLLQLCLTGPKVTLDKTVHCQPAVVVTSLAALHKLRQENPEVIEKCVATAGFSVGEYAALVFADVFSLEDAVRVVKVRAEAMQRVSNEVPSGMITVRTSYDSKLRLGMAAAREFCTQRYNLENPVCVIANYLCTDFKVVAGHQEALDFLERHAKEFQFTVVKKLPVSGAFHTKLMQQAKSPVMKALQKIEVNKPTRTVYCNVTSNRYHSTGGIIKKLGEQLCKPVKWEQILHHIYKRDKGVDYPNTYEVGPSKQLGTFLQKTHKKAFQQYSHVDV